MCKNNFDQSSTGTNIELCIFLDGYLAQMYFEEFLAGEDGKYVKAYRDRRGDLEFIAIWADKEDAQTLQAPLSEFQQMEFDELEHLYELYSGERFYGEESERAEMEDWLASKFTAEVLIDSRHEEKLSWYDLDCEYVSTGYSQGDAVRVWISDKAKQDYPWLLNRRHIDNILWDAPVNGSLTVNGEEYYFHEVMEDVYDYDKDELIKRFRKYHRNLPEAVYQFLEDNLPEYLEYLH